MTRQEIEERVRGLGEWFHNLDLKGVRTAPNHFLGDYPAMNWRLIANALPRDLSGKTVLDIGCNAGFYAMELKRRGAAREVGVSSFGAEEVQELCLRRTAELLLDLAPRVHWYSLYDLPKAWPATTRHREAEGSSYYRHFYMGLLREDGTPKKALRHFADYTPRMGICQWFHFEDHRLDDAVAWLKKLGVKKLRTGLSWADSYRPGAEAWFDRQMKALEDFDVTLTLCFTPEHRGHRPHHTSPPLQAEEFAGFCARMVRRYA